MTATSEVRFGADGVAKVQSYVRLTGQHLHPLLHLRGRRADPDHPGRPGRGHDHHPGQGEVTEDDVRFGRLLAEAVNRYAAELEKLAAKDPADAADPDSCRAGGVMARQMEAGRLELVPPAAPGFSPVHARKR